jgi:alpha-L-rhamnosidase
MSSLQKFFTLCALLCAVSPTDASAAFRLRIEYLASPLSIDVATPRFSYALSHPSRGEFQTSYRITVSSLFPSAATVWDSGTVQSNTSLNIPYGGPPLASDADYTWSVVWADSTGALSEPATATFSTALYSPAAWQGAAWVSSASAGAANTYRTEITLASAPSRARLFIHGLGYAKTWLNGALTDDHELGTFTTFQKRTLYDVWDVTSQLRPGCNALGVMLGHGWFSQPHVHAGDRQFRLLLSVTIGGTTTYYTSGPGSSPNALAFTAAQGPVQMDDIYDGETYSGPIAASLEGWTSCGFSPAAGVWAPTVAPATSPATFGSIISAHNVHITTDRTYSSSTITQPFPGTYVYDFEQNMAGQTTLLVEDCPANTTITLIHNEILNPDGTVNRNLAKMVGTYICAGTGVETYRTHFTYYGFRYVQVNGFPGIPGEEAVTAHFVHSNVPQSGEFTSSNDLLNAVQHATRYASWSNLMDIPTDCPQRERFGWLGDAQLSFETVIHNVDGGGFYTKWLNDFADTQEYDADTMGTNGALPDCIPYYGHGHKDADPGWGIAAWVITDYFSDYYADDVFDVGWYPHMKYYMTHW